MKNKVEQAFDLISNIEEHGGRNDKESLLQLGKENDIFRNLLYLTYNPFLRFHLSKFDAVPPVSDGEISTDNYYSFVELLTKLSKREVTGNKALDETKALFSNLTAPEQEIYGRVLRKDLDVGISIKTINKVFPGEIPVFNVMLAQDFTKVKKKPKSIYVEIKYDGYRAFTIVENGKAKMLSRNGNEIVGFTSLLNVMGTLPDGCYDGEILGEDEMFSSIQKLAFRHKGEKKGILCLFDFISLDEFKKGGTTTFLQRKKNLETAYKNLNEENREYVRLTVYDGPFDPETEFSKIETLYDKALENGQEGLMLKDADSVYEKKKSSKWLKYVPFISLDTCITGFAEGEVHSKNEGTLGAVIIQYKGFDVHVGSGLSDQLRDEIWKNKEEYLGKMVEIWAREPSENQNGGKSLRFPRFKRFRPDKE